MSDQLDKIFLIAMAIMSCAKKETPTPPMTFPEIRAQAAAYCAMSQVQYNADKFVTDECDGAGFTSLYKLACPGNGVDLSVFQDDTGKMFRNPAHDCFPEKSKSEFSKDHVLMRLVAAAYERDKTWAKSFLDFANKDNGFFCQASDQITRVSRCFLSPFLYRSLSKLSGIDIPEVETFAKDDFEGHLDVLGLILKWKLGTGLTSANIDTLGQYADREPLNALYQAAAYRFGRAPLDRVNAAFLNDHWPKDKLPSSENHCTGYLFQRDMASTKDWEPCPEKNEVYSGTDYSFAAFILTN
jgi:hypothetical protein